MANNNGSSVTEFILLGLTENWELQGIFFVLFLNIYIVTVLGNLVIILLIRVHSQLHTPMYFFLCHLSFSDTCYSSSVTLNMLVSFLSVKKSISYLGCAAQFCAIFTFGTNECFLLAVMAYDRFTAICHPLLYTIMMSKKICTLLVVGSYTGAGINAMVATSSVFSLSFCGPNVMNHFLCDFPPLLQLSCSDISLAKALNSFISGVIVTITIPTVLISYLYILLAILKIPSTQGRRKAFSTCGAHLTAVALFYGTTTFVYVLPNSRDTLEQNKVLSVFYIIVIPMLNPFIYSLRNREVKETLRRTIRQRRITSGSDFI
ncbi:olfactory receptor 482-like [Tachyglossus aculeatus]|uniref:olfactory receptor 482-like n=1 Tax=Tachyglossus aculeatus TaxID=9261 RepID=UPI0018F5452B|nr:olfactory receptor 482-like [Tachyglossus aculeatus]